MTAQVFDWLDVLHHRDELVVEIELVTALRVGRGKSMSAETDLPVLRDPRGVPILPGSSVKGVLRSASERVLRGLALGHGADDGRLRTIACDVFDEHHRCLAALPDDEDAPAPQRAQDRQQLIAQRVCLVCATFGGAGLAAHVRVPDVALAGARTTIRDGVGIDRDLARVSGGRKYDFEVVEAGARFPLRLVVDNARDWQLGLLFVALDALDSGGRLGGFGSRGLGAVALPDLDEARVRRRTVHQIVARAEPIDGPARQACVDALLALIEARAAGREVA